MASSSSHPSRSNTSDFTSTELSISKFKDYYAVLGVDRKATEAEIKSRYRVLIKQWHPDKADGILTRSNSVVSMSQVVKILDINQIFSTLQYVFDDDSPDNPDHLKFIDQINLKDQQYLRILKKCTKCFLQKAVSILVIPVDHNLAI